MRPLLILVWTLPLMAQTEAAFSGLLELGYRWRSGVAGSLDAYRSVVNLGEGPKMLGGEFTLVDPHKRVFDRVEARGYNWGDDPYSSLRINVEKQRRYDLRVDYRNLAYFNYLPSFANPLLDRGILLNQRSYDIRRRMAAAQLDLLPGSRFIPYLAYGRSSGEGGGITTFVSDGNEYAVPDRIRDGAANYRGGVRMELRHMHVTLEQGGSTYKDDQQVFATGSVNPGNRGTQLLGQNLFLSTLQQSYGIRGSSIQTRGLLTASATSWLDMHGQFLYSQPQTDTSFQQFNTGSFAVLSQALFVGQQQFLLSARAKLPHTSGSFGVEVRPVQRLRILASWLTDRLHVSSAAQIQSALLVNNYSQEQVDVLFDVTAKLTLRGGHRYVWGDASDSVSPAAGLSGPESGQLRRQVALAGLTFRPGQKFYFSGEAEVAASDRTYFRTSLHDYQRVRARARYQALDTLSVSMDFSVLNNKNPATGIQYDYLFRQNSVSLWWAPQGGKRLSLQADYTRSTLRSDISYLAPQLLRTERSFYRDNAHLGSVLVDVPFPGWQGLTPSLSLGGSLLISSGSRPTDYFQPMARLLIPVSKNVAWVSQWRYYGFGEMFYQFEGFRTHWLTSGLRLGR